MLTELLSQHLDLSVEDVEYLMALPALSIYEDPTYHILLSQIDSDTLDRTLPFAREVYDKYLDEIKNRYGLSGMVMGGHTLANWILGYLRFPDRMVDLLSVHANVPADTIQNVLPELLDLLEQLPEGGPTWQHALAAFTLPLMAAT